MKVDGIEALRIFLMIIAYQCRYVDLFPYFGRAVPDYSIIVTYVLDHIYDKFGHLLETLNQPLFATDKLDEYCHVIHDKGAPLSHYFVFIDVTVRPMNKPRG